jgi:hypothetical protein
MVQEWHKKGKKILFDKSLYFALYVLCMKRHSQGDLITYERRRLGAAIRWANGSPQVDVWMWNQKRGIWKIRRNQPRSSFDLFPSLPALRNYLDTWLECGRSFVSWRQRHPDLHREVCGSCQWFRYHLDFPQHRGQEPPDEACFKPVLIGEPPDLPRVLAGWEFANVLVSPLHRDVGSCDRCKRYFLNVSGHRNKLYCGRRCAALESATRATRRRLDRERQEKLKRARAAVRDWTHGKGADWKQWVSRRTGLSAKFLTRALNRGELKPPAGI